MESIELIVDEEAEHGQPAEVEGATALDIDSDPITREQRRSRRKRDIRARTISVKRMTKRELEIGRLLFPESDYWKPRTRVECLDGPRPCPFVSCKHHLYIDVSPRTGAIKPLEDVGAIMNLTRERIRQVEVKALAKLEALRDMMALRDYVDEGPIGKRRLPRLSKADLGEADPGAPRAHDDDDDDFEDVEPPEESVDLDYLDA
jgi:hypothetical protein